MTIQTYATGADLDAGLARKLEAGLPPKPHQPAPEKRQGRRQDVLLTDEQVLECRRRHEFEGWNIDRLCDEYAQYGVTRRYMQHLLQYLTRSKLVPKRP